MTPTDLGSVPALLREAPWRFTFYQAVRLLMRSGRQVRFRANPAVTFPPSELDFIAFSDDDSEATLTVNFMGLTGPSGVLPQFWTEEVIRLNREKRPAFGDFLDIFNSRLVSLYYFAWEKHRLAFAAERGAAADPFASMLRAFLGLHARELQSRVGAELTASGKPAAPDGALTWYTGLLSLQTRSGTALQQTICTYFQVPVEIEEFVPVWRRIEPQVQSRLDGSRSVSGQLGWGVVAGDEVLDATSLVRLRVGPLKLERYNDFLPGGSALPVLKAMLRFFSNELEFDLQLILARDEVPKCCIGEPECRLGWLTWAPRESRTDDVCDTILSLSPAANAAFRFAGHTE